jgi:glycine/D-amino acid oxidase-like deaminating enzyme
VRLELGCEVVGLSAGEGDGAVRVTTSRGVTETRCVVIAAGAWAGDLGALAGASDLGLSPMHRHLFVSERVADLDPRAPFVWQLDDEFYVRPETGGLLISGCEEELREPHDARPSPTARDALAAKLSRVAPDLVDLGIAHVWACLRTFTRDRRPVIAWDAELPWLYWVAGLGGHGATASPAVGERAAREICQRL